MILAVQNHKNLECVRRLVDAGADVNKQDEYGHTALFSAIDNDDYCDDGCTRLLLKSGTNVNICNEESETALLWAVRRGLYIDELIKAGADMNCEAWELLLAATSHSHNNDY